MAILPSWNPGTDGPVYGMDADCDRVFISGLFDSVSGTFTKGLAALDAVSGAVRWRGIDAIDVNYGTALRVFGDRLFVAGNGPKNIVASTNLVSGSLLIYRPVAVLEAATFFEDRAKRADYAAFDRIMNRTGGEPPRAGDELPKGYKRRG